MHDISRQAHRGEPAIAVVAAFPVELGNLRKKTGRNTRFLLTGMGSRNVEKKLPPFLQTEKIEFLIHLGFSGGLTADFKVGDLIVVRETWQDALGGKRFALPADLVSHALKINVVGAKVTAGIALCQEKIAVLASEKRILATGMPAGQRACVDMESAAVARICQEFQTPLLSIRSISDLLDEDLPLDFNRCRKPNGNLSMGKVLWQVARSPRRIPCLMRLQGSSRICADNLGQMVSVFLAGK
jgi:adenosylhomocysteine nucleosidase